MEKTVAFHTLGCRLNIAESGSIAQGFMSRGYKIVDFGQKADVVFLNTCTVTDRADSTCRNLIRRAHKSSPEATIVVAGCYAQMEPETIKRMQGVDLVLGTNEKYKVFDYLEEEDSEVIHVDKTNEFWGAVTSGADEDHTRAFLKIQDGCNYVCSFCIIPFARGRSRTITIKEAVKQAQEVIAHGKKEIVITGVNIGEYEGRSGEKLSSLIQEILNLEGLERLRLSSVEPNTITDELLDVLQSSPKFLDHFHVPLQSGDDAILKLMRRKYDRTFYQEVIGKIKSRFPRAGIGADIIVGFPGETEEQFQNTFNLVRELPLTHFHVFPFSKRKGTTAATLPDHIPHHVKKARVRDLIMFGEAKLRSFMEEMVGQESSVLFERRNKQGLFEGHTTNYLKVMVESAEDLQNQVRKVHLLERQGDKLLARLL